jgi:hypothetical protein
MAELTPESMRDLPWSPPWRYVGLGEGGYYELELAQEARSGHPLYDARAIAVGARVDRDDVLFLLPNAPKPLAVVHLTYKADQETDEDEQEDTAATLPRTTFYLSLDDWLNRGMNASQED